MILNFLVHVNIFEILLIYLSTAHELGVFSIALIFLVNSLHVSKDNYAVFFNEISYCLIAVTFRIQIYPTYFL